MSLTNEQILRYSRHLIMPEVGLSGQEKLVNASVLLIGAGGLGSPLAMYLSAAGIGHLGLVDFDKVDHTNLHRQVIHGTENVGMLKVESAKQRIASINPNVKVDTYATALSSENIMDIIKDYDVVIDGTDNFPTRYLVNDACVFTKKPNIYGSIFRFEGQATVFYPGQGPCYRCLYPEPPPPGEVPSCAEGGVLGILPGIVGLIQATECIKLIIGQGKSLVGRLLIFNALEMSFREVRLRRQKNCPVCGDNPTLTQLIDYQEFCGLGRGQEEQQTTSTQWDITPQELKEAMSNGKKVILVDVREKEEWDICRIPGAKLIPLSVLPQRMSELDTADDIVLHCHHGSRSMKALQFLNKMGFQKLKNLRGGD
jgi:sulfur-carrier protein adenylyltransferase/sulfurtransferase